MRELMFWGLCVFLLLFLTWSDATALGDGVITYCDSERGRCYKFRPDRTDDERPVYAKFMNLNPSVHGYQTDGSERYDPVRALQSLVRP